MSDESERLIKSALDDLQIRLEVLEANAHPPARDMIAGPEFDKLVRKHETLDRFSSTLAAQIARVENMSQPAKGTTAQRLEALENQAADGTSVRLELYTAQQHHADELARLRGICRELEARFETLADDGVRLEAGTLEERPDAAEGQP